jgi:hypothetical protein
MTLLLPPHQRDRLLNLLSGLAQYKRVSRRKWHRLLGELRSMTTALHSAKHLFCILQHVLIDQPGPRIRLTNLVRQALQDWQQLATSTANFPVPLASLVPSAPTFLGATDASKAGMGGFWIPTTLHTAPPPPPSHIAQQLASTTNPTGAVTNSDLELAALVTGSAIAATFPTPIRPRLHCAVDNTPTLAWANKGSTSSTQAPAFLLRLLAQLCRTFD